MTASFFWYTIGRLQKYCNICLLEMRCLMKKEIDMLHGSLWDKLIFFALPMAATSILQQLFTATDLAVVGKFNSSDAMAAVGSNAPLINLLIGLFIGLSIGANVLIASLIGKGDRRRISEAVHTVLAVALICGFLLLAAGEVIAPWLLAFMGTPGDVFHMARLYLRIYFLGMPFFMIYNFGSAILRSKGDSTHPLISLALAGLINVFGDLLLVIVFHMGVAGVAIATVSSMGVNAFMTLYFLAAEPDEFHFSWRKLCLRRSFVAKILQIGVPAGLQGVIFSFSNVIIQSAINSFGADCIAGNTAGQNFEYMAYFVINAFSQTAVTFTSQNFSAGRRDRCARVYQLCTLEGLSAAALLGGIFALGRHSLILIFTKDPAVMEYAYIRILFVAMLELMTGVYEISGGCLRGMGHSLTPTVLTTLGCCGVRLVWIATAFRKWHDIHVLMSIYPITWAITGTVVTITYFIIRRREFRRMSAAGAEG